MKVVSSAKISERHQRYLRSRFPEVSFYFFENIDQAKDELKNADILITYGDDLSDEIINKCNSVKWINVISSGLNKIPFSSLKEKQIYITNAKGIHSKPMSEYTFGVIFQLARKSIPIYNNQQANKWDRSIRVSEINGSTIGIIGLGSVGKEIAFKAKAFDMKVIGTNSDGRPVVNVDKVFKPHQLNELLAESDYVILITPLTKDTYHLIGKEELKAMKESAYLINIARGDIVNESALINALKNKEIAGAVLDVFTKEPLPDNSQLWNLENCIITPHVSGRSPKYMERALEIFQSNLELYLKKQYDKMKNLVDLDKGY